MKIKGLEMFAIFREYKGARKGDQLGVLLSEGQHQEIAERLADGEKLFLVEKPGVANPKDDT